MDSDWLFCSSELVAGSGHVLSVEQKAALQTSLLILKKNYKFHRVMFWGKILGLNNDYFIAQGRGEDELKDRKYLYSFNCMDWFLLPSTTNSMIDASKAAKGRFRGDPSYVYEQTENGTQRDGSEAVQEPIVHKVTEETRLAVTVEAIDKEVSIVPRGAFIKNPHCVVQANHSFGGLSHLETRKLENFLHFSEPKIVKKKSLLEMAHWNPSMDFLDALSDDLPKGSWSLQFECAGRVCVIRSLLWLGLTFFHLPMTPLHGYVYFGFGDKNVSLPFML
ncbi:radial spoke head protein 9 homolog [Thalassophryne amazonica]|uniref:radial spoke head protein 9 homolog n=1 Tax=Thalassophryne amazonica TaxID=390379 RepID=UPI001470A5BB|nr:radial spoke head protein 9 homolog [Thalassophryne amazonica]